MTRTAALLRFTISYHRVGSLFERQSVDQVRVGDHLDWFFQSERSATAPLRTLSTAINGWHASPVAAEWLPDHRARYLDYAGEVSGQRGSVQPLVTGFYHVHADATHRFEIRVLAAAVVFDRHDSESRCLNDPVRSAVGAFLFGGRSGSTSIEFVVIGSTSYKLS